MRAYDIGDTIRVGNGTDDADNVAFEDPANTPTDPTTVTLTLAVPDGTTLEYAWPSAGADGALVQEGTGRFYYDVVPATAQQGVWHWRLEGSGTIQTVAQGAFFVRTSVA